MTGRGMRRTCGVLRVLLILTWVMVIRLSLPCVNLWAVCWDLSLFINRDISINGKLKRQSTLFLSLSLSCYLKCEYDDCSTHSYFKSVVMKQHSQEGRDGISKSLGPTWCGTAMTALNWQLLGFAHMRNIFYLLKNYEWLFPEHWTVWWNQRLYCQRV